MDGTLVLDLFTSCGLAEAPARSLIEELGAAPGDPATSLSRILDSELEAALDAWKIAAGQDATRVAKAAERSKARQALERTRVPPAERVAATESRTLTAEQIIELAVKASRAAASASSGMVKVSSFIDQVSEQEVPILKNEDIQAHYQAYKIVFKRLPPPGKECTCEQLSCLFAKLESKCAPYTDFAIFCPFGQRFQKRLKMRGLTLHAGGEFKPLEIYGPSTFQEWDSCYELLITGLVGFKAVELGNLLEYQSVIKGFHERYGPSFWPLIYQAESRMRAEQMERLRRGVEEKWTTAKDGGFPAMVEFNPEKPWDAAWRAACEDTRWWKKELEDTAEDIKDKVRQLPDAVDSDAPVSGARGTKRTMSLPPPPPVQERPLRQPGGKKSRVHNVVDGMFTTNRSEDPICKGWQDGTCTESLGKWCSKNWGQVHQRAKCSDTRHGAHYPSTCQGIPKAPAVPAKGKGRKGKGSGKSKGGKGKSQY